ncbi:MAG: family 43 glycosylhydrolase [Candidatus Poseidoniaceae archaeon]|nr:family 43 glycosylhydrolase [Candidatus Poseidoniaceae archaeon]
MKRINALTFSLLLILSTTAGCFGGEEEIEIEFDFDAEDRTLLGMGDSVMEWNREDGSTIPDVVGELTGFSVLNKAESGARIIEESYPIPTQFVEGDWDWVIINGGANDIDGYCGEDEIGVLDAIVSDDVSQGDLVDLVNEVSTFAKHVMLASYYDIPSDSESMVGCEAVMEKMETRYEALANTLDNVHFFDMGDAITPSNREYYDEDLLHPSPAGCVAIGTLMAERILEIEDIAESPDDGETPPSSNPVTLDSLETVFNGMNYDDTYYYVEAEWVVHDPSEIVEIDGMLMIANTGKEQADGYNCGLETWYIFPNETAFSPGQCILSEKPAWISEAVSSNDGAYWAPGFLDARTLYYTVPVGNAMGNPDSTESCIGMVKATGTAPNLIWTDHGSPILCQPLGEENRDQPEPPALDPATFTDDDGRTYLIYGGAHIWMTEINATTGEHLTGEEWDNGASGTYVHLANGPLDPEVEAGEESWTEAAYVHKQGEFYYLFVNWYRCCGGPESTYEIYVGRSTTIDGTYVDANGVSMLEGGGTLVMDRSSGYIGPGHPSIFTHGETQVFTHHFYPDGGDEEDPMTDGIAWAFIQANTLTWNEQGWPVVGETWDPMTYWNA